NDSRRAGSNAARGRTSERALAIARTVDGVADALGCTSAQVATAWVLRRSYGILPIVGARKVEQLVDCLGATEITLSDEHLRELDEVSAVSMGFPHAFLQSGGVQDLVRGEHVRPRLDPRPG
ncbi:MAG: aldo/keto reductase, partial [Myxococcales bacterium]|nr:aldo/keto reductase [Myxococcales bacterium]